MPHREFQNNFQEAVRLLSDQAAAKQRQQAVSQSSQLRQLQQILQLQSLIRQNTPIGQLNPGLVAATAENLVPESPQEVSAQAMREGPAAGAAEAGQQIGQEGSVLGARGSLQEADERAEERAEIAAMMEVMSPREFRDFMQSRRQERRISATEARTQLMQQREVRLTEQSSEKLELARERVKQARERLDKVSIPRIRLAQQRASVSNIETAIGVLQEGLEAGRFDGPMIRRLKSVPIVRDFMGPKTTMTQGEAEELLNLLNERLLEFGQSALDGDEGTTTDSAVEEDAEIIKGI